ncbi:MAG TPA: FAD-dependent monooxygenase [Blastocatellia bacterium]|nr:FAD-dependent monooxygenase [Blastocatellia bacterium]
MKQKVVALSNPNFNTTGSHAVVIGGSMAGMLAARILNEQFDHVTVLERDQFPDRPTARAGLPQARHVHVLLARGRMILEELFPGISVELKDAGARFCDSGSDLAWLNPAGWAVRYRSGQEFMSFTRDLLDWVLRRRMQTLPNVRFVEGCDVTGLVTDASEKNVTGITMRRRGANADHTTTTVAADFVVDASGRGSKASQWLEALGYPAPEELTVNAHFGYASRLYRIPADWQADWQATYSQSAPPKQPRFGLVFPVENNCWMVTIGGGGGDYAPTDEDGILEYARSLPNPMVYEAIKNAEPVTPIHGNRSTINRLRFYEKLARRPERFVVMGDGVCAFNPVYGQGMTIAAMEAMELKRCVQECQSRNGDLTGLAATFQQRLAQVVQHPWMMATGEDYRFAGTEGGETDARVKFLHWYIDHVTYLTTRSVAVRRKFMAVQNLLIPPSELFSPGIVLRVLGAVLTKAFQREAKPESRDYRFQPSPS